MPKSVPRWLKPLLEPQSVRRMKSVHLSYEQCCCQELCSGFGGVSLAFQEMELQVVRPMEAFPSTGVYVRLLDIDRPEVEEGLLRNVGAGLIFYM
jgi:hypothetical protein